MNLKEKYSENWKIFDSSSTQNAQFENINSFLSKKYSSKKLTSRHNEQPKTLTRQEYKSKNLCPEY
jgi:hypothetical protein